MAIKLIVKWRASEQGRIAVFLAVFFATRINSPPVAND
jgi:hypothetical protein